MRRILLQFTNAPLFLLLAAVLIAIQSALFISFPLNWLQPDLLLTMVIWSALKRGFFEGGVMTLLIAHLLELHSSAPQGVFLTSSMSIFLGARLAARIMVLPDFQSWIRLTIVASMTWKGVALLILFALGKGELQWRHTLLHLLPGAMVTGLAGAWVYPLLDRLDRITFKKTRPDQSLNEDLPLVESEGIS